MKLNDYYTGEPIESLVDDLKEKHEKARKRLYFCVACAIGGFILNNLVDSEFVKYHLPMLVLAFMMYYCGKI